MRWRSLPTVAPAPAANPTTTAKVQLGRRLFHDTSLSLTRDVACASCHDLEGAAGADARPTARGILGLQGRRNTPSVWNAAFQARLFWDGRAASLEEQALGPITNPIEMGMPSIDALVRRLDRDASYREAFADAFDTGAASQPITGARIAAALAAFERTLITADSPYDRFVEGEAGAMSPLQLRGMALFESLGCVHCHSGPNFSAASVFDGAAPFRVFPAHAQADPRLSGLSDDPGRAVPGSRSGVWRIPSLRNVAVTAPYFHDGSVDDLEEAVRIMARTQLGLSVEPVRPRVLRIDGAAEDAGGRAVMLLAQGTLSQADVAAVAAFLDALTSPRFAATARPRVAPHERGAAPAHALRAGARGQPPAASSRRSIASIATR